MEAASVVRCVRARTKAYSALLAYLAVIVWEPGAGSRALG